ncbi:MAG: LytR C-terminal domain-containing protein [Gemmatimonadaceae bacterium]
MRKKGRWILLALVVGGVGIWAVRRDGDSSDRRTAAVGARPARVVPESLRIRVEVLNATTVRGLARRATFHLRDLGFDVVGSGNSAERLDSTVVLVRSGRQDWGDLAAAALGGARVEARPDSSRYLDLTILLGANWRPPPEAFHP